MSDDMRPPVNLSMRVLDRAFFQKTIPISAARIYSKQQISHIRKDLEKSKDILARDRLSIVQSDPNSDVQKDSKCLLLNTRIKAEDSSTWGGTIQELVNQQQIKIIPYELHLDYGYWTYHDIMTSIMPMDEEGELPSSFNTVGHVAHLNLRDQYLDWKHIIAQVILDKNSSIKTVINKINSVGEESEFRTFAYEVLAGPDNLNVETKEGDCIFRFDYGKVYWNSRLNTEHRRLVDMFKEGDAVCDVMAGVGPFAVPAGKTNVFVWANDLNPDSYKYLVDAIKRNKVVPFVKPFNENGHSFIRTATAELLKTDHSVPIMPKKPSRSKSVDPVQPLKTLVQPKLFSHFVMNLPGSAITFLPSFIGLYASLPSDGPQLDPDTTPLPMVHCYTFGPKADDNAPAQAAICEEVSGQLGYKITPQDDEVEIWDVRDVAPKKRMFCASFRLPREVAWRKAG
ncbi:guanine methyltransferase Trm5 [Aulographum hederae CBS 113979]|uniref:tRNA (guanine(37)-N1)-methyltransferase n=1 Tax=Aulographum hederae CBS 113979 TaxID=1176131 RepID=A0A6G1H9S2_9PEZI|nr:guanine methyltransferase Trm5 [Aulographum hederae CBS 113979]